MATQVDVQAPDVVGQEVAETSTAEPQSAQEPAAQLQDADKNWKQMREALEEKNRQLRFAQEREKYYQEQLQHRTPHQTKSPEPEETFNETDILTVSQAKKVAAKEVQRILREQENSMGEDLVRRKFPDYDAIATPENLERLRREDPQEFRAIAENPTNYGKASALYKTLKLMVGSPEAQQAQVKLKQNEAKPRSAHSVAPDRPLHHAHNFEQGLTADLRKSLLEEMQNSRRNY